MRGADIYSDHCLVRTRIRLKLARADGKKKVKERFVSCRVKRLGGNIMLRSKTGSRP